MPTFFELIDFIIGEIKQYRVFVYVGIAVALITWGLRKFIKLGYDNYISTEDDQNDLEALLDYDEREKSAAVDLDWVDADQSDLDSLLEYAENERVDIGW